MSIFLETNHLFLRSPGGEVENMGLAREAGFGIALANVGDYPVGAWDLVHRRAKDAGVVFGPWLRIADASGNFDAGRLERLLDVADLWDAPGICNSEKEIDHSGSDLTAYIARQIGDRDFAISMEVRPFSSVDWTPLSHLVVAPQNFPGETGIYDSDDEIRRRWWEAGMNCVAITYGAYHGMNPTMFKRLDPYGVYSGNDCGGNFHAWGSLGEVQPCRQTPPKPDGGGEDVAEPLPPGAFDDCAKMETTTMKRPDGKDATAFTNRATSLKAMRDRITQLEDRIIELEQK